MERLLVLRLESSGCGALVEFNGVPVASVNAQRTVQTVPVHEFAIAGGNEVALVVQPGPIGAPAVAVPQLSEGRAWVRVDLVLPRIAQVAHPDNARSLAHIEWAPPEGELYETPLRLAEQVDLPIAFPRWRWLDAPVVEDLASAKAQAVKFLQRLAVDLARGDPESFVSAARLRFEEVALAYQRNPADEIGRWRVQVQALRAKAGFKPFLPSMETLQLRPVAAGRLLECLTADGQPALRGTGSDGSQLSWPVRVAQIEGRLHVLR